jgi:hypothetical protein
VIRTSSARRRARTAVGALLAAAALTACSGGTAHQGAAAVVGGQRISIATVEGRLAELRTAVAAQPGGPRTEPAGLTKQMVSDLVLDQVVARALADRQLSVSDGEIAQVRETETKLLGGENGLRTELLLKQGIPAEDIDAFYRQQLGIHKIAAAQGKDARTAEGDAVVRAALADAGGKLRIDVNPRYGRWDPQRVSLIDAATDWLPQPATAV